MGRISISSPIARALIGRRSAGGRVNAPGAARGYGLLRSASADEPGAVAAGRRGREAQASQEDHAPHQRVSAGR